MLKQWMISTGLISCLSITGCANMASAPVQSQPKPKPTTPSQPESPNLLYTQRWVATEINGFQVQSSEKMPQIQFDPSSKRFSGSDGCNQIMGSFNTTDENLSLGQIASTKMMCTDANSLTATQYQQALEKVARYRASSQLLVLFDQNGQTLIAFKKTNQ
ncbi:META domain-containing protein [Acinetobacter sp. S40]|uniref:META domain-containing protein n=1 Tax=Acinetobacter sp. S40 TaxID=2767434 RepID=UPI00190B2B87|nr:META domain-containing protein [Acinetobacter sp. S40]MBJ9984258.1 META domain-containing protein [Acinetobacter sp. S40]